MHRRSFFHALSGLILPLPASDSSATSAPAPSGMMLPPTVPDPDPEWLREWRRIPRLEVFAENLPFHNDPHQQSVAAEILPRIRAGMPFAFRYLGGSEPGQIRRVLPTLLFCLDYFSHYQYVEDDPSEIPDFADSPLFLQGWCQNRNAPRTFRLDRIMPVAKHET